VALIHYWYDPLCGWCYGAAPLLQVVGEIPGLRVALRGGGLFSGAQRQRLNGPLRQHILAHDQRIAALSGQPFGAAYRDGLLQDAETWLDSDPPTAAVLAAEALAGQGLAMLHGLHRAHYQQGRRIAEPAVLVELAQDLGLAVEAFRAELQRHGGAVLAEHLVASRRALAQLGGWRLSDPGAGARRAAAGAGHRRLPGSTRGLARVPATRPGRGAAGGVEGVLRGRRRGPLLNGALPSRGRPPY